MLKVFAVMLFLGSNYEVRAVASCADISGKYEYKRYDSSTATVSISQTGCEEIRVSGDDAWVVPDALTLLDRCSNPGSSFGFDFKLPTNKRNVSERLADQECLIKKLPSDNSKLVLLVTMRRFGQAYDGTRCDDTSIGYRVGLGKVVTLASSLGGDGKPILNSSVIDLENYEF